MPDVTVRPGRARGGGRPGIRALFGPGRLHVHPDVEIAVRAAITARFTLSPQPDPLTVPDAGRDAP